MPLLLTVQKRMPGYSSACLHVCGHKARLQTLLPTIRKIRSAQRIIKRDIDVESNLNEKISTIKFIILTKMTLYIFQYNLEFGNNYARSRYALVSLFIAELREIIENCFTNNFFASSSECTLDNYLKKILCFAQSDYSLLLEKIFFRALDKDYRCFVRDYYSSGGWSCKIFYQNNFNCKFVHSTRIQRARETIPVRFLRGILTTISTTMLFCWFSFLLSFFLSFLLPEIQPRRLMHSPRR